MGTGETIRVRPWVTAYVCAFVGSIVLIVLFSGLRGYPTDQAAVVIALPITVYVILKHLLQITVPTPSPNEERALAEFMRQRPPLYRVTVKGLAVVFVIGVIAIEVAVSLAVSAWAFGQVGLIVVADSAKRFAWSALLTGLGICGVVTLTVFFFPLLFHIGRTVQRIVFNIAATQIRRGEIWYRGSVA